MISLYNVSKYFGKKTLFENISLSINKGEKIGLIGPNGAGKTTLFSLILGENEPSSGTIQVNKGVCVGYLPQEARFISHRTVLSEMTEGDKRIVQLKKEKETLEKNNKAGTQRYGEILHELETLDYFELEYKAKKNLSGLGFKESDFSRLIADMSGGWQMRTLLVKLLTFKYDILLLDEPTNYLDLDAALWFKDYLSKFQGTFIMISHDKSFLTDVTNFTLVLEEGLLIKVKGNYDQYVKLREERRQYLLRQFKEQEKKRQQLERFISRFHAQPNKASQVRAKKKTLERMAKIEVPSSLRESIRTFRFPQTSRSGYRVVKLENISKSYGDIAVYKNFDFEVTLGEKAVLVGENGAGKSTLLKIVTGVVEPDEGTSTLGHNVEAGYFSQTRMDVLNLYHTVLEEAYTAAPPGMRGETIRTILGAFLFCGDDVDKSVGVLSGGEKSRLILAKLLINPPNFLVLDEPTTHLDVDAVEALIKALKEYEGTLMCISHDIHFVRSIANMVYEVKNGKVTKFPGNFDYYQGKKAKGDVSINKQFLKVASSVKSHKKRGTPEEKLIKAEKEKKRKAHNLELSKKIKKLSAQKQKLQDALYVMKRILANPAHDEHTRRNYRSKLQNIEKKVAKIENQIGKLKTQFILFR